MAGLMPKVFEEANLSGELRLSGRKLKDFPKTAAKYNLSDTVIAGKIFYHLNVSHILSICSCRYLAFYRAWKLTTVHFKISFIGFNCV